MQMIEKVARHDTCGSNRICQRAMREPTEAMVSVFERDLDDWFSEKIEDPMHLYKVMIDAVLEESEEKK